MMHNRRPDWSLLGMLALAAVLASCGGGGNESGLPETVEASPSSVEVGQPGQCVVGLGPTVHVYGGRPPYKLSNSVPQGMLLSNTTLQNSGDGFTITFTGGVCLKTMPITIEDQMGRVVAVPVSNGA